MEIRVKGIVPKSPADGGPILPNDVILAVNGQSDLQDLFDYQFAVSDEPVIDFKVKRGATELALSIQKPPEEDPGLIFDSPIFTPIKTCNNACPFCFIDQQPEGLRKTLYVKDDDWRLSYFNNTYITLTNLTRHDRERIAMLRPGPLYVSVHCTVPEIRTRLLVNPKAAEIMKELKWLASLEIPFHCQLVICPGINDGDAFTITLSDLVRLRPYCESIAVVPLGLTQHRSHLEDLKPVTKDVAVDILKRLRSFQQKHNAQDFAFASDEFYDHAEEPLPAYESYGEFPQLDDGVGTARHLSESFYQLVPSLPASLAESANYLLLTGKLGAMTLNPIAQRLNQIENLYVDVMPVESQFWGEAVTVAGLITGGDILSTLKTHDLSGYKKILIPQTMVREEYEGKQWVFLDGEDVESLSDKLSTKIEVVENPNDARYLLGALNLELGL